VVRNDALRDVPDVKALEAGLSKHDRSHVVLLDMKRELDALYPRIPPARAGFAVLGVLAIAVLLMTTLRSAPARTFSCRLRPLCSSRRSSCWQPARA
jgi:hypothetical protein